MSYEIIFIYFLSSANIFYILHILYFMIINKTMTNFNFKSKFKN